jgi:hypothetical protein
MQGYFDDRVLGFNYAFTVDENGARVFTKLKSIRH